MSKSGQTIFSLVALCVLAGATLLTLALISPPAPLPSDAPPTEFSAQRAMQDLAVIAREPRPMGTSVGHAMARDYLLNEIRSLGLEPEVQDTLGVRVVHAGWVVAGAVENILVRLPGTNPAGAILLTAHYDTAPGVPGGADNGSGVVTLLELLRALQASPQLRHDVLFLFTDGEEPGTIGAHAFVAQHPWFGDVSLAINIDTVKGGPSVLEATSPENGALIEALANTSSRPAFISLPRHLFPMGESDLLPFLFAGVPAVDIHGAAIVPELHTALDQPAVVNPASVQHVGSQVLSLVRHLGDQAELPALAPNATFFPFLGALVHYPSIWARPLAVLAGLVFLVTLFLGLRTGRLAGRGIGLGLLTVVLGIGLSVGIASLAWLGIQALHPQYGYAALRPRVSDDFIYAIGFFTLTLAIMSLLLVLARRRAAALDLAAGMLLFWLLGTIAAALLMPAISYLGTWTLLSGSIALGIGLVAAARPEVVAWARWAFLGSAIVAIMLWVPVIHVAFLSLGLPSLSVMVALAALLVGAMLPVLDWIGHPKRWLLPTAALLVAVGFLAAGHYLVGRNSSPPLVNPIGYWLDADKDEASWVTFSAELDARQTGLFVEAAEQAYSDIIPSAPSYPVLACPAPMLDLAGSSGVAGPMLEVLQDGWNDGRRVLRIKIATSMKNRVYVIVPDGPSVLALAIPHNETAALPPCAEGQQLVLRFDGAPVNGFEVSLELDQPGPFEILLVEERTGLPSFPGLSTQPLPGTMRSPGEFDQSLPTDFTAIGRAYLVSGSGAG